MSKIRSVNDFDNYNKIFREGGKEMELTRSEPASVVAKKMKKVTWICDGCEDGGEFSGSCEYIIPEIWGMPRCPFGWIFVDWQKKKIR